MSDFNESMQAATEALRKPISEAAPGGADVGFDPSFEQLKGEIDKLSDMGGAQPDWKNVAALSREILAGKAKDFRAAIWFATAGLETNGWTGFAEGLTVVRSLAVDFWDTMFPDARRARARGNQFTWMLDRVKPKLESLAIRMPDGDAVRHVDAMLSEIDSILGEKVGDAYGGLGDIRMVMRSRVRDIPEPPPPAPEPSAAPEPSESATTTSSSESGGSMPSISSPDEVESALFQIGQAIMGAAAVLRAADPNDAAAYRLQRVGAWLPIRMLPPADGNTTMLPGPDTSVTTGFASLVAAQAWASIIEGAERATGEALFWLDPHRWSALALDHMGSGASEARAALGREVVAYVTRLPGIEKLSFADGTPFADAATRAWLDEERGKWGGGGGGATSRDPIDAGLEDAESKAQSGQLAEALATAMTLTQSTSDARRRFEMRLRIAKMAKDGGRLDMARAILEGLLAEADRHALESWEPALCVPVLRSLVQCYVQLGIGGPDERGPGRRAELFDRLCRLDASAAAGIELG